jgi:hypothetical protein
LSFFLESFFSGSLVLFQNRSCFSM